MSSPAETALPDSLIRNIGNRELSRFGHTSRRPYWVALPRPMRRISGPASRTMRIRVAGDTSRRSRSFAADNTPRFSSVLTSVPMKRLYPTKFLMLVPYFPIVRIHYRERMKRLMKLFVTQLKNESASHARIGPERNIHRVRRRGNQKTWRRSSATSLVTNIETTSGGFRVFYDELKNGQRVPGSQTARKNKPKTAQRRVFIGTITSPTQALREHILRVKRLLK
jgi:hypothetical protein